MSTQPDYKKLVEQCQTIPVLNPGSIQNFGALIAVSRATGRVDAISDNLGELVDGASSAWLGQAALPALHSLFGLLREPEAMKIHKVDTLLVHRVNTPEHDLLEVMAAELDDTDVTQRFGSISFDLLAATDIAELHRVAQQALHELIGFGHIMVYRFDENWNGEVVAESILPGQEETYPSYLDLHFPETDIPSQARALYAKQWVRNTADTASTASRLIANKDVPVLLSDAYLRSVAPTHIRYLRNMGVTASFSVSIIVEGKLWGLLAAHHHQPQRLGFQTLRAAEEFAKLYSSLLTLKLKDETRSLLQQHDEILSWPMRVASAGNNPFVVQAEFPNLLDAFAATGLVFWDEGIGYTQGQVPELAWCARLVEAIVEASAEQEVLATSNLSKAFPDLPAADCAGLLAIGAPFSARRMMLWFRPEEPREVDWGGNPNLDAMIVEDGMLNPRNSFSVWSQTLTGVSREWSEKELTLAAELSNQLLNAYATLGTMENVQKTAKLNMLNMLLHDIGNALAGVAGEVNQVREYQADHAVMDNLVRLETFIRGQLGTLESALGQAKAAALYQLISEVNLALADKTVKHAAAIQTMELGLTHVRELLDLQKTYAQSGNLYTRECHIGELLSDAVSVVQSKVSARGSTRFELQNNLSAVTADRSKLMQVLINLVQNACEAWDARTGDKPPLEIICSAIQTDSVIELSVMDNGAGFGQDVRDKLFIQPFSTKSRSSGVGLVNCMRLANAAGVNLDLESAGSGQGAVAKLEFPKEVWA